MRIATNSGTTNSTTNSGTDGTFPIFQTNSGDKFGDKFGDDKFGDRRDVPHFSEILAKFGDRRDVPYFPKVRGGNLGTDGTFTDFQNYAKTKTASKIEAVSLVRTPSRSSL